MRKLWNAPLGEYYTVGDSLLVILTTLIILSACIAVVAQ